MSEEIPSVTLRPSPEPPQTQAPEASIAFGELLPSLSSNSPDHALGADLLRAALAPLMPTRSGARADSDGPLDALWIMFRDLGAQEDRLDAQLAKALSSASMSTQELLALQAQVYRFTLNTELLSKVIEKGTGAIKQLMNTQV